MTSRLVTPWWLGRGRHVATHEADGTAPTPSLDWGSPEVRRFCAALETDGLDDRAALRRAHAGVAARVRPVYALDDVQPASRTLALGRGSCSQRMAVLEAVARSRGVATRSRGLLVDGRFWYGRFPRLRFAVPEVVLIAWPELLLDGRWESVSELYGPPAAGSEAFTNRDGETLFDAIGRSAVDWDGDAGTIGDCVPCDLSANVVRDLGRFPSRDDLVARHGQSLCRPLGALADPVLSRWSPV